MARKKRVYSLMDENATKSREYKIRITPKDRMMLDRLSFEMSVSKSEILRIGLKEMYKTHISDE